MFLISPPGDLQICEDWRKDLSVKAFRTQGVSVKGVTASPPLCASVCGTGVGSVPCSKC